MYIPPFDDDAVEGWGTRAVIAAKRFCADQREGLAIAQYTSRSDRRPRRAAVRQEMFFKDVERFGLEFEDGDIFERGFAGGACGLFA